MLYECNNLFSRSLGHFQSLVPKSLNVFCCWTRSFMPCWFWRDSLGLQTCRICVDVDLLSLLELVSWSVDIDSSCWSWTNFIVYINSKCWCWQRFDLLNFAPSPLPSSESSSFLICRRKKSCSISFTYSAICNWCGGGTCSGFLLHPSLQFVEVTTTFIPTANTSTCINCLNLPHPSRNIPLLSEDNFFNLYNLVFSNAFYGHV